MNFIKNIHPGEKATAIAKVRHHGHTTIVVDVDTYDEQHELTVSANALKDIIDSVDFSC